MIFAPSEFTLEAIERLVSSETPEDRFLEYKSELPNGGDEERREFLADVSCFANTAGGTLLYGITEKRDANGKALGVPEEARGISIKNVDAELRRLMDIIRGGIAPRIPGVELRVIEGFPSGHVLACHVPASWLGPHMVTFKTVTRFYVRVGASKQIMGVDEIRDAFLASEGRTSRLGETRTERLSRILSGDAPIVLADKAHLVVHLMSPRFPLRPELDVARARHRPHEYVGAPGYVGSWDTRWNLDGFIACSAPTRDDGATSWYTQVHRAGMIEVVNPLVTSRLGLHPKVIEESIIDYLKLALRSARAFELATPLVAMAALVGVRGERFTLGPTSIVWPHESPPITRDVLVLPDILLESDDLDLWSTLRPMFDVLWQSGGWPCSSTYDDQGNRRKR